MAIFKLAALDGSIELVVRARCLTCARAVAVEHAGTEGTRVWRDPNLSSVELVRETDKTALILRAERK
ncbi:hypothetical protein [Bordetella sp. BOR01]|uniref:hypothetical protein n=1 Tax=Bordetella sp. BOR01 TaxID=2854779 RepID=UPI001C443048|nr:hypothetical protein [Bordetella sp. BOR01]MBV7482515.1 hypothetical protein [Bordetella sp. BOR01]